MPSSRTPREFRTEMQESFLTYWNASGLDPLPPIVWDNKPFTREGDEYVSFNIAHATGTIAALGNEKYRRLGRVVLNIWVPEGDGQQRTDELAEAALGWFETVELAGVRLRETGYNETGSFGGYWQSAIASQFEYDAIRT